MERLGQTRAGIRGMDRAIGTGLMPSCGAYKEKAHRAIENFDLGKACVILMILFYLTGCTTTKLLKADFESGDTPHFPDLALPGDPRGDRIFYEGPRENPSGGKPPLEVRNGALDFWHDEDVVPGPLKLGFRPNRTNFRDGGYIINWNGLMVPHVNKPLFVRLTNSENDSTGILLEFEIYVPGTTSPPQQWAVVYSGRTQPGSRPDPARRIGRIPTDRMVSYLIVMNVASREYSLLIGGNQTINGMLPSGIEMTRAPNIWFSYGDGTFGAYNFEDILVLHSRRTEEE